MANHFENPSMIAMEANMALIDNADIVPLVARDTTSDFTQKPNGYNVGKIVNIKTESDPTVRELAPGGTTVADDFHEMTHPMTIEKHFYTKRKIGSQERAMEFSDFIEKDIVPSVKKLAQQIDEYVGKKLTDGHGIYHSTTLFESADDVAKAREAAMERQLDKMNLTCLVDTRLEQRILGAAWFNQAQTRGAAGETSLATGNMGMVLGMNMAQSLNFNTITQRPDGSAGLANQTAGAAAARGDTSVTITAPGAANTGLENGAWVKFAGRKREFRLKTGAINAQTNIVPVFPLEEGIANSAAYTVPGAGANQYIRGVIFDRRCAAFAMIPLDPLEGAVSDTVSWNGISFRVSIQGSTGTLATEMVIDCLVGCVLHDPRRVVVLSGDS